MNNKLTKAEIAKGYIDKAWCSMCEKWAYTRNPKLVPRHQHIGFGIRGVKHGD